MYAVFLFIYLFSFFFCTCKRRLGRKEIGEKKLKQFWHTYTDKSLPLSKMDRPYNSRRVSLCRPTTDVYRVRFFNGTGHQRFVPTYLPKSFAELHTVLKRASYSSSPVLIFLNFHDLIILIVNLKCM